MQQDEGRGYGFPALFVCGIPDVAAGLPRHPPDGADSCLWESAIPKELSFPASASREHTPARDALVPSLLRSW